MTEQKLPSQRLGTDGPVVSRIALGCMGMTGTWNPAEMSPERERRAITAYEAALDAGITLFDHADIYGGGTCEEVFKACLAAVPGSRDRIVIATKGGIRPGHYNLSAPYLRECVERSLTRMGIDRIDLYQLHRPDPLTHPRETAGALNEFLRDGRVLHVGVSNYYPEQVRALQAYLDAPILSNQFSFSLTNLAPLYEGLDCGDGRRGDGTLDQCLALGMTPLAYSPLGGGRLTREPDQEDDRAVALRKALQAMADQHDATPTQVALAWLLAHPAGVVPLVGSADPAHIGEGVGALKVQLTREEWYELWVAAWGHRVP
ncbi:MAG TPA: aldo/keto reductase [Armatimonadota bacterium]|jgi:predicted oxidoreductase